MYVFGGRNSDNVALNDLWAFNLSTYSWTQVIFKEGPLGRTGHSCDVVGHYMVIFGGYYKVANELNDLQIFDFKHSAWRTLYDQPSAPYITASKEYQLSSQRGAPSARQELPGRDSTALSKKQRDEVSLAFGLLERDGTNTQVQSGRRSSQLNSGRARNGLKQSFSAKISLLDESSMQKDVEMQDPYRLNSGQRQRETMPPIQEARGSQSVKFF